MLKSVRRWLEFADDPIPSAPVYGIVFIDKQRCNVLQFNQGID